MHVLSKTLQLFSIIVILTVSLLIMLSSTTLSRDGFDKWNTYSAFAQLTNNSIPIQITSTSTYIDDLGNFHVIGEVNNTSVNPQTNVMVTALLSDTNNNVLIGNYSAFSSINTLRPGELSPFDILIQDPQIVGKFNFMEFSTSSQPAIFEKPANLLLNGSNSFLDNVGNPHIVGSIINQGPAPEQFLNLVVTFYDNSSLGVVGTQSFGLNVGNLSNNQMVPFDLTITDNKTKSQAQFYSLNVASTQSSMGFPLNTKFAFEPLGGFIDGGSFLNSPTNVNPLTETGNNVNDNDNNDDSSPSRSNRDNSDQSSSANDLDVDIDVKEDPLIRGNTQTINVIVADDNTHKKIANADADARVFYTTDYDKGQSDQTDSDGVATFNFDIGPNSNPGTFVVTVKVNAAGYNSETERTTFEVIKKPDDSNDTSSENNSTDSNDNSTLTNGSRNENSDDLNCEDINDKNVPVGDNDPNNFDGDGDGIGCESNGRDDAQTNNDANKEPKSNDETTSDSQERNDGTITDETTGDSSDSDSEQTDRDGDGVSNEQPENNNGNGDNGADNEDPDPNENDNDEEGEEESGDKDPNSDQSDDNNNT